MLLARIRMCVERHHVLDARAVRSSGATAASRQQHETIPGCWQIHHFQPDAPARNSILPGVDLIDIRQSHTVARRRLHLLGQFLDRLAILLVLRSHRQVQLGALPFLVLVIPSS